MKLPISWETAILLTFQPSALVEAITSFFLFIYIFFFFLVIIYYALQIILYSLKGCEAVWKIMLTPNVWHCGTRVPTLELAIFICHDPMRSWNWKCPWTGCRKTSTLRTASKYGEKSIYSDGYPIFMKEKKKSV